MSSAPRIAFITPTWAGDLEHFRVMRRSFEQSPLVGFDHYVVVQDEDLSLFEAFRNRPGLKLLSTRDVLPAEVEYRRARARKLSERFGRDFTRICGSLKRLFSWPLWPAYTGWHTQQLCKFKLASELDCDVAVVLDSDVVVTPSAVPGDFFSATGAVCFAQWLSRGELEGKVSNWVTESERLVGADHSEDPVNVYFDTPFVLDRRLLISALDDLSEKADREWWFALLDRPPRRWSEFGFYKAYLTHRVPEGAVDWREPSFSRYVYDTSDPVCVVEEVAFLLVDPAVHYITIHSQASGRENWDSRGFLDSISSLLDNH
ncbi:DUF6492 family protein [Marinobacter subterrani]|uniref:DUF6492 family protein n=1 Tax=Marinobacter subterrani TaxID=1658765 RepID=UPI0023548444|nr:DUF6492 family protein [Marinobacter subterrani]